MVVIYVRDSRRRWDFYCGWRFWQRIDPRWHIVWKEIEGCIYPCPAVLTYCRGAVSWVGLLDVTMDNRRVDQLCAACIEGRRELGSHV